MANSKGQRLVALLLALMFLLTSVGAAAFVIWEINKEEGGLVNEETNANDQSSEEQANTCGSKTYVSDEPRAIPQTTTATVPVTELKKVDVKVGDGEEVQAGDCVAALYYGTLASNGQKFDGNYETGAPVEFSLEQVIPGWQQGIPGMKVGGIRRLEIPAALAYGEQGSGETIPPNSDLVFEVEIIATRRGDQ